MNLLTAADVMTPNVLVLTPSLPILSTFGRQGGLRGPLGAGLASSTLTTPSRHC